MCGNLSGKDGRLWPALLVWCNFCFWVGWWVACYFCLGWDALAVLGGCSMDLLLGWVVWAEDLAILTWRNVQTGLCNAEWCSSKMKEMILEVIPLGCVDDPSHAALWVFLSWISVCTEVAGFWKVGLFYFYFCFPLCFECMLYDGFFEWMCSMSEVPRKGYALGILLLLLL